MKYKFFLVLFFLLVSKLSIFAQIQNINITGTVIDKNTKSPLVSATVQLLKNSDSTVLATVLTDSKGKFIIKNIASNKYILSCSFISYKNKYTLLDLPKQDLSLGKIELTTSNSKMQEVIVVSDKNSTDIEIDRKVYDVSHDIMAQTGSATDILRNVPSVNVNIDGRVSLRGTSSVTILINGKPSPLMRKSLRAETLQQLPANSIERIEVITNPSASFKSNGTGGVINIVLKKNALNGWNASLGLNVSTKSRYNSNASFNYKIGKLNLFSNLSVRQDNRYRSGQLSREYFGSTGTLLSYYSRDYLSQSRPVSYFVTLGADYTLNDKNDVGISGNFHSRNTILHEDLDKTFYDIDYIATLQYDRTLFAPQDQNEVDATFYWQHNFTKKDEKLRFEINTSNLDKHNNNHYSNIFQVPANTISKDNIIQNETNNQQEIALDYSNNLSDKTKIELGYSGSFTQNDMNLLGENYDFGQSKYVKDYLKSNEFVYNEKIHAIYGTCQHKYSKFGYTAGVRLMQSFIRGNLVTKDSLISNDYFKIFPTLHLVYKLKKGQQIQLNYSKRVNFPESTDLNPFADYRDPRNLQSGNPKLMPEIIHSTEIGYKWQNKKYSFVPSLYYRYKQNGFTNVLLPYNDSTTLRTQINLSHDHSVGLEMIFSVKSEKFFSGNISTNFFYSTIDSKDSSRGYANKNSIFSMSTNFNATFLLSKNTAIQINCNYRSAKLTPQGKSFGNFVANAGARQYLFKKKMSVTLTASDLFKTLNQKTQLTSGSIHQISVIKRDSQIFYLGLSYRLGKIFNKSSSEEKLQYDNDL